MRSKDSPRDAASTRKVAVRGGATKAAPEEAKPDHKKLGGRKKGTPSLISRAGFVI